MSDNFCHQFSKIAQSGHTETDPFPQQTWFGIPNKCHDRFAIAKELKFNIEYSNEAAHSATCFAL